MKLLNWGNRCRHLLCCFCLATLPSCEAIKVSANLANIQETDGPNSSSADLLFGGNINLSGYFPVARFSNGRSASNPRFTNHIYHFAAYRDPFVAKYERSSGIGLLYEPGFIQKGAQYNNNAKRIRLNYLELPVCITFRHYGARGGWWSIGAGPFVAFGAGGSIKNELNGQTISSPAFGQKPAYSRFDAGLRTMFDYKFPNGVSLGLCYDYGLANVSRANGLNTQTRCYSASFGYSVGRLIHLFRH